MERCKELKGDTYANESQTFKVNERGKDSCFVTTSGDEIYDLFKIFSFSSCLRFPFLYIEFDYITDLIHNTRFPIRFGVEEGATFWAKWPNTAWSLQDQHSGG